ncbi:hypothetical protein HW132_27305 [Brasilonema sp. CT11]|nr:hypothetical protein [Brasilonema sp. CT11]
MVGKPSTQGYIRLSTKLYNARGILDNRAFFLADNLPDNMGVLLDQEEFHDTK